ncbi:hypothetical protein RvY_11816 [Ramazzottius varieornatus]|uniref:Uncharacterized protein n=1 Tax=Ramazzottius varieornatus TaxID=947166 RepID=A0A1D1VHB8_RAMVA|nr:hypothetical protein RvY_11816 [Ramazzottius varieornatus]
MKILQIDPTAHGTFVKGFIPKRGTDFVSDLKYVLACIKFAHLNRSTFQFIHAPPPPIFDT